MNFEVKSGGGFIMVGNMMIRVDELVSVEATTDYRHNMITGDPFPVLLFIMRNGIQHKVWSDVSFDSDVPRLERLKAADDACEAMLAAVWAAIGESKKAPSRPSVRHRNEK